MAPYFFKFLYYLWVVAKMGELLIITYLFGSL